MKTWWVLFLGICLLSLRIGAQDEEDDEDVDIEEYDEPEADATLNVPKEERPVYKPPKSKGNTYFADAFISEDAFSQKWVMSKAKKDDTDEDIAKYDGKWSVEEPSDNPLQNDLGLVLKSRAKHHAISAKLDTPFKFDGKPLVLQYEVKFQNGQECGGAYVKLLMEEKLDLTKFYDKTPFTIMFGPDKCGNDDKLHFIFQHKNPVNGKLEEKHAKKTTSSLGSFFTDKRTHLYTLVVSPENRYEVYVDQDLVNYGNLLEDFTPPVNPPRTIVDPNDKKPEDWDEREKIKDPDATKPEDWDESAPEFIEDMDAEKPDGWLDDEPELIPDPDAEKPEDWDEDMDGEWEAPMINNPACESAPGCGEWNAPEIKNPAYKGKWTPPMIDNPDYKGKWKAQMIDNPDFFEDRDPYAMSTIYALGLELWSMSDDIMFDNFIITDEKSVADEWAAETWTLKRQQELAGNSGQSVVQAVMDMTNERPWLWAVILLVVVLPVVLLIAYCCSSGSSSKAEEAAERKKTDAASPDDDKESDDEESEQKAGDSPKEEEATETGAGDTQAVPKKPSKSDLETEDAQEADAEDDEEEAGDSEQTKSSPRKRKTRTRKD